MKQVFCERKPQRRVRRSEECGAGPLFPVHNAPAGDTDETDALLADIEFLLDQRGA